jgi:hypothetical protein
MIVDHDGRIVAQADPGPGEKIVVGPVDVAAVRAERDRRLGHHMLAHRRTEAYRLAGRPAYPAGGAGSGPLTIKRNEETTREGKERGPG